MTPEMQWPTEPCRSCGKPVIWCVTSRGKDMPVSAEIAPDGNVMVRAGYTGPVADVLPVARQFGLQGKLRRSHFADCPQADKWRRHYHDKHRQEST